MDDKMKPDAGKGQGWWRPSLAHPPKVLSHVKVFISARDPEVEGRGQWVGLGKAGGGG